MSVASMTGFGRSEGSEAGAAWAWELRSVNGRGLELRLRLPPGLDVLEAGLRDEAARALRRGNVNGTLTLRREERARVVLDQDWLRHLLVLVSELARQIPDAPPPRPEALLALPGVMRNAGGEEAASPALIAQIKAGFSAALAGLVQSRQEEGGRLAVLLGSQLDSIGGLRDQAARHALGQPERQRARMMESLRGLTQDFGTVAPERIAQELALLATRADVQEELDRLSAHLSAAQALLAEGVAIGRRLDFLVQEFVRETNTLCSKSATVDLTSTGLQLKAVIEQMREQVQNVE